MWVPTTKYCDFTYVNGREKYNSYYFLSTASTEFKIRVRGSQESFITSGRGRVEVQYRGVWGTVCDTEWDLNAANVVCREMGWKRAARPSFASEFGQTWGPIWMDFVRCHGDEYSLDQCGQTGWGLVSSCTHGNDAGVVCTSKRKEDFLMRDYILFFSP